MPTKQTSEFFELDADFKPLPKYGHLSAKVPEYVAAEPAIKAGYDKFWELPSFAAFREAAGDADAPMPPGGPDRYRDVTTELLHFPARDGSLVELKVYKSPDVMQNATLMYRMHGGGWVVGSHEVDGAENVFAALNPNIVVVSVKYRLAPEHPFPTAIHDNYDGLLWCKENAKLLGINPEKIIISGSSAGGNLAAVLALEARDSGISGIIAQVLHFPITCFPSFFPKDKYEYGSYNQNWDNAVLGPTQMESAYDAYIPDPKPDHRHSPLLAASLEGLPPTRKLVLGPRQTLVCTASSSSRGLADRRTVIQVGGVDVLRDEGLAYAEALEAVGVTVEAHAYVGLPHCFPAVLMHHSDVSTFYERYTSFLKRHTDS